MGDINNVMKKGTSVMLDKERSIVFTLKSFAMIAQKYESVQEALNIFGESGGIKTLSKEFLDVVLDMAEAGLVHDKDIDRETISECINLENIAALILAIRAAIKSSLPESKDDGNPQ